MSRNDTETQEALDLDQRWDELNAGNPALRRLDRGDQELRELVALDASAAPRPEFVSDLMGQIWAEARQIGSTEQSTPIAPIPLLEPVRPVRRMRRMRGLSGAGKVASVLLAASLLFAMMAALVRYPFTSTDGTGGPTVVAPGPQIPDVPMPGADPARTNVQARPQPDHAPRDQAEGGYRRDLDGLGGQRPGDPHLWHGTGTRRQHAYRTLVEGLWVVDHIRPRRLPTGRSISDTRSTSREGVTARTTISWLLYRLQTDTSFGA